MIELEAHLRSRRDAGRKLLVPYVTGGLGDTWQETVQAVVASGADAVEIGIPFSDPVMDGPTIQEASHRALLDGATPTGVIKDVGDLGIDVPFVAMTYYNVVFRTGHRRFARLLADNGFAGAVIPDVPLEELHDWARAADDASIATVLLAAPVTPEYRLRKLCDRSGGFIYAVSVMGVTGERDAISTSASVLAKRLKAITDKPVLVGFGVSTPRHAVELSADADGVITASVLMRCLLDGGTPEDVGGLVADMRAALDAPSDT